jgi:hypothetical protein
MGQHVLTWHTGSVRGARIVRVRPKGELVFVSVELTTNDKGGIAEAAIVLAAVQLGVVVARPITEGRRYDVVFDIEHRLLRVQCKWGAVRGDLIVTRTSTSRHTPRGYVRTTYSAEEIDAIAIYCHALNRCFLLPIQELAGQSYLHLRLAPARNNQRALVRMADDYDIAKMISRYGAVAQLGERLAGSQKVRGSSPLSSTEEAAPQRGLFAV